MKSKEQKDVESYVNSMKQLMAAFGQEDLSKLDISKITDKGSEKACATLGKEDTNYNIQTPTGRMILTIVRRLFGSQILHAARCGQLLKQLFLIKRGEQDLLIRINPTVLRKGFPELDRINQMARQILVDYYSRCERLYKKGLEVFEIAKGKNDTLQKQIQRQQTRKQVTFANQNTQNQKTPQNQTRRR
jgi:hypothetical protein